MQDSCVEECKGRAAFAFCSTLTGMQLRSKRYARPAIHRSIKRPFPHFTSGVRNQGANGVSWYRSRLSNSAGGKTPREIPNPKLKMSAPAPRAVPFEYIKVWRFLGVWSF